MADTAVTEAHDIGSITAGIIVIWRNEISERTVLLTISQVLAIDLLNPAPQAEAKKHKLKVR